MENSTTALGPLCALGASVTWAVGSAGYSRISRGHSAFAVNFARAAVALPLFFATVAWVAGSPQAFSNQIFAISNAQLIWLAVGIFASYGLGDVLFMWSTRSLGVPAALAIASTYPLLTAGVGAWVQGESLTALQVLGLFLAVIGLVTVILGGGDPTPASSEGSRSAPRHLTRRSLGVALAFGTMLMWTLNSVAISRTGFDLDPFVANCYRMIFGLGMSFTLGRVLAPGSEVMIPWRVLKKSLPVFVFEAYGGSLLFIYGLSHSPLAIGATLSSLAPVLAVPVAWAYGLEKFSVPRTLGVCSMVLGLSLLVGRF